MENTHQTHVIEERNHVPNLHNISIQMKWKKNSPVLTEEQTNISIAFPPLQCLEDFKTDKITVSENFKNLHKQQKIKVENMNSVFSFPLTQTNLSILN